MRRLALLAMLAVLTPWVNAQSLASTPPHFISRGPAVPAARGGSLVSSTPHVPHEIPRPFPFSSLLYPFGALADFSYDTGYPVASEPPIIVMQSPPASTEREREERQPQTQALLIELQGDRYVHLANGEENGTVQEFQGPGPANSSKLRTQGKSRTTQLALTADDNAAHELPPALLIFRDGHSEQIRNYTIADGMIYAQGDYYTDGYWTKKIDLRNLDLPETIKSNETRKIHFILPSSPNEVITRP